MAQNYALIQQTMVTIPGGTFMMGYGMDDGVHQAAVSTFQMGQTPVTNDEYARHLDSLGDNRYALIVPHPSTGVERVVALGGSEGEVRSAIETIPLTEMFPSAGDILTSGRFRVLAGPFRNLEEFIGSLKVVHIEDNKSPKGFDAPRQPAVKVSWFESFVYAFLHGGMLPTEWQWEYAARVVQGSDRLRDYATPSGELTREEAHYNAESTVDVDDPRYPTLENGLRHMTGNVLEWMQNWIDDYPEGPVKDPTGPKEGGLKHLRGGSFLNGYACNLRAVGRDIGNPDGRYLHIGFRCVAPALSTVEGPPQDSKKVK